MASFNKTMIMGNLTRDLELRYTPKGTAVANVGVAVNEYVKDGDDKVTFFDVVLWGKNAENCAKYLGKGSPIFIEGRMATESWTDKESGKPRSKMVLVANVVQFLGASSGSGSGGGQSTNQATNPMSDDLDSRIEDLEGDDIPF